MYIFVKRILEGKVSKTIDFGFCILYALFFIFSPTLDEASTFATEYRHALLVSSQLL